MVGALLFPHGLLSSPATPLNFEFLEVFREAPHDDPVEIMGLLDGHLWKRRAGIECLSNAAKRIEARWSNQWCQGQFIIIWGTGRLLRLWSHGPVQAGILWGPKG